MPRREREPTASGAMMGAGLAVVGLLVVILFFPMSPDAWDTWGAAFVGPAIFLATLPALARQARREGRPGLYRFLVVALIAKLAFSALRYYHAFYVVEKADAQAYDRVGSEIATRFLHGDFTTGLGNLFETNFIRLFTGMIYTVIRPSAFAGFLIFASLAFWGTFLLYRAFVIAVPDGNRHSYAKWLFFMPSILFWPSSIGKESWMIFGLGIAAYGAARTLEGRFVPGILMSGIGIGLSALVRAPIAALFGLGLVVASIVRRRSGAAPSRGLLARGGVAVVFAALGLSLFVVMQHYLVRSGFEEGDLETIVSESQRVTSTGGSEFAPASVDSPTGFVVASVTVLFRPFPHEAGTLEAVVTSLEASLLLLVSLVRWRSFLAAIRSIRRVPYVALAAVYVTGSIFALSPVANFGILARHRVLIYPMLLVFMCFRSSAKAAAVRSGRSSAARPRSPSLVGGRA